MKLAFSFFLLQVCGNKNKITKTGEQQDATEGIFAKAPAVLPISASASSMQMSTK